MKNFEDRITYLLSYSTSPESYIYRFFSLFYSLLCFLCARMHNCSLLYSLVGFVDMISKVIPIVEGYTRPQIEPSLAQP